MKKNDSLTKNTIFLSVASLMTKGLQFIMIPFFSSWLSIEEFGNFDLLCTYVMLAIPIVSLASTDSIFRFSIDKSIEEQKKVITNGFFIYVVNTIFISILVLFVGLYFKWNLILPFIFLMIGQIFNDFFQGYMRGLKKIKYYSFCMGLSTILIAIFTTFFLKILKMGLDGILFGYAFGYIIANIVICVTTKFHSFIDIKDISMKKIKEMIKYSFPLVFNNISWWIVNVSDRSIINYFLGMTVNGIYAVANKVPGLCTSVFSMFSISWQQKASEMENSETKSTYFNSVFNTTIAILISLCSLIISVNFILFDFIFDAKYSQARFHAPILVASILFMSMTQFLGGIQISLKKPKENGITTIIAAFINIIVHLSLIKFIGLYAASLSTLVSNVVLVVIRKKRLKKDVVLKIDKKNYLYFFVLLYIFTLEYFYLNYYIRIIDIFISLLLFFVVNKKILIKIIRTVSKKISR